MARIPQETIDRINDNADIVDVVSKQWEMMLMALREKYPNK